MPRVSGNTGDDHEDHELPPDPFGPGIPPGIDLPPGPGGAGPGPLGGPGGPADDPLSLLGAVFGPALQGMFAQLGSLFSGGALPWDMTRQVATWTATGGTSEPNVVPVERIRLEELLRIALPHVEELAEVPVVGAGSVSVDAVTRAGWVADFLDQQRNLIERLAASLSRPPSDPTEAAGGFGGAGADPFRGLLRMLGPSIVAMQVGGMAGQLATRALSGFDLPLPRTGRALDRLVLVPVAIDGFADTWGLPRDDVRLRIILGELAHIAVMRAPGVAPRLLDALGRHADGFRLDPDAMGSLFDEIDPTDPASMQVALGDPGRILGALSTPAQDAARAEMQRIFAVVTGWVDHVVGGCVSRLLGSDRVGEALRRRRLEPIAADQLLDQLLGLRRDRAATERGIAFVRGVVERSPDRLHQLLSRDDGLPTEAEIDAPGLWLARLEL